MVTFPGFSNAVKFTEWYYNRFMSIVELSSVIWAVFNTVSTIVTIVGILKIIDTLRELKKHNPNLKTNYI
jgi:hypothetical protein